MELTQRLQTAEQETDTVRVIDGWYEVEEDGHTRPMPVLHYHGRTDDGAYRHWSIEGYRPYFLIARADTARDTLSALDADRRVIRVEQASRQGIDSGEQDIDLLRVVVECPWHVADLREHFPRTFEADVLFPQRFLIDKEIRAYTEIPSKSDRLAPSDVQSADPEGEIEPRIAMWDIEVDAGETVPNPDAPTREITAVTLHDSYEQDYYTAVLRGGDAWHEGSGFNDVVEATVEVFDDEAALIIAVVEWLVSRRPDILSGWNANAFDWPYFVNRGFHLDLSMGRVSPTGNVERHEDGGRFVNSDVTGIHLVDMLDAYRKSRYHSLKSKTLAHVSAMETDLPKLDVDEQDAYANDPARFIEYSVRDVEACVAINEAVNLL